jgi:hypothetical protein
VIHFSLLRSTIRRYQQKSLPIFTRLLYPPCLSRDGDDGEGKGAEENGALGDAALTGPVWRLGFEGSAGCGDFFYEGSYVWKQDTFCGFYSGCVILVNYNVNN